jgi:hypothetical protein
MANKYNYIDKLGKTQVVEDVSPEMAIKNAKDIAPTSGVSLITPTPAVVSSKDNENTFKDNSNKLKESEDGLSSYNDSKTKEKTDKVETASGTGEKNKDGKIETTGDPILDRKNAEDLKAQNEAKKKADNEKKEYQALFNTSLSAIDATAQATINDLNTTFTQRIEEQNRINDLNIARTKAYGLGSGGQYTPISFTDSITMKEREASDQVKSLET